MKKEHGKYAKEIWLWQVKYYIGLKERVAEKSRKIGSHAYKSKSLSKLDKAVGKPTSIQHLKKSLPFTIQTKAYRNKMKPFDIMQWWQRSLQGKKIN